ncbi:hypothetical protein MOC97_11140 [Bacillus atrophaeus]|uniref:hypothetical protein n=1 Tax=Bacillus atrophaeus TaxID=1452 RepID=UPI002281EADC|nr:hypothetical protein [Bacillus atrophaeus]MCY8486026.1 hypothetical protein [Bacillus atrophaeus]MEC2308614.1 hypothetical protein [Bacillus atrophaeus]
MSKKKEIPEPAKNTYASLGSIANGKTFMDLINEGLFSEPKKGMFVYMEDNRQYNISNNSGSAFSFGSNSSNVVMNHNSSNNELAELTQALLKEIKDSNLDSENEEQLNHLVHATTSEANTEKPKKILIKSFLDSADSVIKTATTSVNLISAFEKWKSFFS